jgi:hypothetical protein
MVNYNANPLCKDSNEKLMGLYEKAEKLAVQLVNEYSELDDWNPVYQYTFGSKLIAENDDNILYSSDAKKGNEPSTVFDSAEQDGCHVVKGGMPT